MYCDIIQDEKDHGEDDSLQFTGRLFGGLIADVKRKIPWFVSDFTDAFHIQVFHFLSYYSILGENARHFVRFNAFISICYAFKFTLACLQTLASIIYIYLATVTKAITFGGFLGDITNGLQVNKSSFLLHTTIFDTGSFGILHGPSFGWWCLLLTGRAATHSSRLYRSCSHFREDSC